MCNHWQHAAVFHSLLTRDSSRLTDDVVTSSPSLTDDASRKGWGREGIFLGVISIKGGDVQEVVAVKCFGVILGVTST